MNDLLAPPKKTLMVVVAPKPTYTQADLVNAAIKAEPGRADQLTAAFMRGWEFTPGQLGLDGLPLLGQLPRPTRQGSTQLEVWRG